MKFKNEGMPKRLNDDPEFIEDQIERKKRRAAWYKQYAGLEEGEPVDFDNLDQWALKAAGCKGRCSVEEIQEALQENMLTEAPTAEKGQIEEALNKALRIARRQQGRKGVPCPNVLLYNEAGTGRSSTCKAWAAANGLHLVMVICPTLDPEDVDNLLNQSNQPNSVLLLDEFNRASKLVRARLLELINGEKFSSNFLFAIATVSPSLGSSQADSLDSAEVSRFYVLRAAGIQESVLTEAPTAEVKNQTLKQAAEQVGATQVAGKGQIEEALDRALKVARRKQGQRGVSYPNVLFFGEAGTGKTSICRAWAAANGINLVEVRASALDPTDIGGLFAPPEKGSNRARKVSTGEFDQLEQPNSVLFLDEFNRANRAVRGALLELVNSHYIPDSSVPGGQRFLPNFLFTIATANPPSGTYNVDELDPAEISRFRNINIVNDNAYILRYLTNNLYAEELKRAENRGDEEEILEIKGKIELAKTLLGDKRFAFDDAEDLRKGYDKYESTFKPLNYRSFTELLDQCDGTKRDFLDLWNDFANPDKKRMAEGILENYVDVEDKANEVLKTKTNSPVFKSSKRTMDILRDKYPEINQ